VATAVAAGTGTGTKHTTVPLPCKEGLKEEGIALLRCCHHCRHDVRRSQCWMSCATSPPPSATFPRPLPRPKGQRVGKERPRPTRLRQMWGQFRLQAMMPPLTLQPLPLRGGIIWVPRPCCRNHPYWKIPEEVEALAVTLAASAAGGGGGGGRGEGGRIIVVICCKEEEG
jgi:hypothetical protein